MSYADKVFLQNCKEILNYGFWDKGTNVRPKWQDGEKAYTIKRFCVTNRYDLQAEFPIITVRKTNFSAALDEILWIWQKKSNRIAELGSKIWDSWAGEDGTIGKAYGYQLGLKYDFPEGKFDQVDKILFDLKNNPLSRRIMANMYNFADLKEMNLYPCAYSLTLNVTGNRLNGILNQRSQDMLVANNWNVVQYSLLLFMFAISSGLEAGELVHIISDAHIYDRHIPIVEGLFNKPQFDAPKLIVDNNINYYYDFSVKSFSLENYKYNELTEKIPVAI